jgi:ferric-dicitrate binding protein FerR (iron transport regulator)
VYGVSGAAGAAVVAAAGVAWGVAWQPAVMHAQAALATVVASRRKSFLVAMSKCKLLARDSLGVNCLQD